MTEHSTTFCQTKYEETFEGLKSLRTRLPETSFASLAREVLDQVALQAATKQPLNVAATQSEIEDLSRALISKRSDAGAQFISNLQSRKVPVEDIYLGYLAAASRLLGAWWEEDRISLFDVTVGTGRIYSITRAMAGHFTFTDLHTQKSAAFIGVPGETHTLGVNMAADLFRKQGWEIDLKVGLSHQELVAAMQNSNHIVIGLSGGGIHCIVEMARLIVALRISNPNALILVSGNIVHEARETIELMDVDAMSSDFEEAQADMDRLWDQAQAAIRARR